MLRFPDQTQHLDTFSDNNYENINKVTLNFLCSHEALRKKAVFIQDSAGTDSTGGDTTGGDSTASITTSSTLSALDYRNAVVPGLNNFELIEVEVAPNYTVSVNTGYCIIQGVLIKFSSSINLNYNSNDSYIFGTTTSWLGITEDDVIPDVDSLTTCTVYVCIFYDKDLADDAYIGLIANNQFITDHIDNIIILGLANLVRTNYLGTNYWNSSSITYRCDDFIIRPNVYAYIDGNHSLYD